MEFVSRYSAKQPDEKGVVYYESQEHAVWEQLYRRQITVVQDYACDEFLKGLDYLSLKPTEIPQLPEVSARLEKATGWRVAPVKALISAEEFFTLLADRHFPAATFIRTQAELDYVKEPDIFHELFGHCPMLVEPVYADFICEYAKKVLQSPMSDWPLLQRFFWFTVEFGLIQTQKGLRAYGGGILSSIQETVYSVDSPIPQRRIFIPVDIFRTPYRIDMLQTVYYVIHFYQELYDMVRGDFSRFLAMARSAGEFKPTFPVDKDNPNIHIFAC